MCGIVCAIAQREVQEILVEGLRRLEYRGYDSAGVAVYDNASLKRVRSLGKVQQLADSLKQTPLSGMLGIAHTRWATHGKPSEINAHPHISNQHIGVVHNGIIENFEEIKADLISKGYHFESETDTEVVAHLVHNCLSKTDSLVEAVRDAASVLRGAYALGVIDANQPDKMIAARLGSPLVIGVGMGENFIASDPLAMLQVTDRFIYLENGDVAEIGTEAIQIWDVEGNSIQRPVSTFEHKLGSADRGEYRHFMLKEIFEQPDVVKAGLDGRISETKVLERAFGADAPAIFDQVKAIQIIACGTSYHAGMVAKYWIEDMVGIPCLIEVASEYRYRKSAMLDNTLFITISQSGETADTLAALRYAKERGLLASLAICNVPGSTLVRETDLSLMTNAGPEIGVASTKAFTSQLLALLLTTIVLARRHGFTSEDEAELVAALHTLPEAVNDALALNDEIETMSEAFAEKHHSLFLGRGTMYPIAMEGALKLKEISYIHAEAYPAGELKHGPLALVDKDMPIVTVAPHNDMLEKLKANLQEVRARGGELFVFSDARAGVEEEEGIRVVSLNPVHDIIAPLIYTIPLQLFSYYVALLKGTDVDQPRNLAKSVTVE